MEVKPTLDEASEEIMYKWLSMSKEDLSECENPEENNYHEEYLLEMRKQNNALKGLIDQMKILNINCATIGTLLAIGVIYILNRKK